MLNLKTKGFYLVNVCENLIHVSQGHSSILAYQVHVRAVQY